MKRIASFTNSNDAESAAMLLRSHGIVTQVTADQAAKTLRGLIFATNKVELWSVVDYQYDDALALLADAEHVVETGLSKEEIEDFEDEAAKSVFTSLNKAILVGIVLIFLMTALLVFIASNA